MTTFVVDVVIVVAAVIEYAEAHVVCVCVCVAAVVMCSVCVFGRMELCCGEPEK